MRYEMLLKVALSVAIPGLAVMVLGMVMDRVKVVNAGTLIVVPGWLCLACWLLLNIWTAA